MLSSTQETIVETANVSGPGVRNATSEIEAEAEAIFADSTVSIDAGGVTAVPTGLIEELEIASHYIECPVALPGSTVGDRLELRVVESVPESGKVLTATNTTEFGEKRWCPVTEIPLPDDTNMTHSLPDEIQWDYDIDAEETTLYITLPNTNTTAETDSQTALDAF